MGAILVWVVLQSSLPNLLKKINQKEISAENFLNALMRRKSTDFNFQKTTDIPVLPSVEECRIWFLIIFFLNFILKLASPYNALDVMLTRNVYMKLFVRRTMLIIDDLAT